MNWHPLVVVAALVILVMSASAAANAQQATIPIVMASVSDRVGAELVASLARPGGNVTGLTNQMVDLAAKRLQLLKEAIPKARRVLVMFTLKTAKALGSTIRSRSFSGRMR